MLNVSHTPNDPELDDLDRSDSRGCSID